EVVSDDGALLAAVDEALAANPDVADKIRGGKVQAAGAIVGAVMKATRGQADAARVRELIMERVGACTHPHDRRDGSGHRGRPVLRLGAGAGRPPAARRRSARDVAG